MSELRSTSNNQILQELDALSHSMYQAQTARRTASLALPRTADTAVADVIQSNDNPDPGHSESRPRSRRMSMSPWRSRPKSNREQEEDTKPVPARQSLSVAPAVIGTATATEKKSLWSWKPVRALSRIRMNRLGCLFSVEVVAIQGLPASMNGLRLAVSVRKKESKDGAVQTMPARVLQGSVDFEETLFVRCNVYCSGGAGTGKPLKLEERLFVISILAIDALELDFGKNLVDLSSLVKESVEKLSSEGARVRQWNMNFPLIGKAKGGELMVKLGFQIMDDGGVGIYNQNEKSVGSSSSSSYARKQSKSSFSVPSPKISRSEPSFTPTRDLSAVDIKGIDDFSLDGPGQDEPEAKEDLELPEFEVVDKGIEVQDEANESNVVDKGIEVQDEANESDDKKSKAQEVEKVEPVKEVDEASVTNEVVKEVVLDSARLTRVNELEAIAQQIQALESIMTIGSDPHEESRLTQEDEMVQLDADEETVTKEFLQLLESEGAGGVEFDKSQLSSANWSRMDKDDAIYISDLGKGLGPVVQTRDGGYLASMNPFNVEVEKKDTPKLAMQISKPFIITDQNVNSFEIFQRLAAAGVDELGSKLYNVAAMDELMGKTAEQIAFEGMASVIISRRSKEIASSSAARSVAALKTMGMASTEGRRQRIITGIWNAKEEPVTIDEILTVTLQNIETMSVEALKIQADMTEEQAPFDVSALPNKSGEKNLLETMIPPEEWVDAPIAANSVSMVMIVQLRDPLRRYETVGAPSIAVIQAVRVEGNGNDDEARYKVASLHVGGIKVRSGLKRSMWDGNKQRLTAMQWLVAYGLGKAGRKNVKIAQQGKGGADLLWSISSRVMADMWLKPLRNPDVKLPGK